MNDILPPQAALNIRQCNHWIKNYLVERTQVVAADGFESNSLHILSDALSSGQQTTTLTSFLHNFKFNMITSRRRNPPVPLIPLKLGALQQCLTVTQYWRTTH